MENEEWEVSRLSQQEEQALVNRHHLIVVYVQGKGYGLVHGGQRFRIEQDGPEDQVWEAVGNTIKHESLKGYTDFDVMVLRPQN